jgi:hypothetical protein
LLPLPGAGLPGLGLERCLRSAAQRTNQVINRCGFLRSRQNLGQLHATTTLLATARSVMWWSRAIFSIAWVIAGGSFRFNQHKIRQLPPCRDRLTGSISSSSWPIIPAADDVADGQVSGHLTGLALGNQRQRVR